MTQPTQPPTPPIASLRKVKELGLTEEQVKALKGLQSAYGVELFQAREQLMKVATRFRAEVQAIYTPEQKKKMKKLRIPN